MADLTGFDANEHEPNDFSPIPAGKYVAVITKSESKPTKAGNGSYLELEFQIVDGEHKGRQLWSRLNLENQSDKAKAIARGDLSAICRAIKVMRPKDSGDLHNLPMVVRVSQRKRQDTGEMTNEIRGYLPLQGSDGKDNAQPSNENEKPKNGWMQS